jgi:drug/metabolite transporter (DMT)-like permease
MRTLFAAPFRPFAATGGLPKFGPRARAATLASGAVLFWATWPTLATLAGQVPPFLVFGLAAGIGYVLSLLLAVARGRTRAFLATPWRTMLLVSVGQLVTSALFLFAMPRIGAAEANVISYLWPVMLVLILARWRGERLGPLRLAGIGLGFAGAAFAIGPTFALGFDPVGVLLAVLSGLTFAVYAAIRSFAREPGDVIGPSMALMSLIAFALHLAFEPAASLSMTQVLIIAAVGIAPLTISNALWDRASRTEHTSLISAIAYATPLASIVIMTLFGVGAVSWPVLVGAVLVVAGALAASGLVGRRT